MKKVTFAILGMGNRGTAYGGRILRQADNAQIVAMADNRRIRLDAANKYVKLPEERLFDSADSLLAQPKLADVMIIATQDSQHKEHALRAMELGYDLLLEKPISNKLADIVEIAATAKRLGRRVLVCHVLRYTPLYLQVRKLIKEGAVGKVMSVEAAELVGYFHYMHSYVRGNWHNEAASSPMILAKCSHDLDILVWLTGKHCKKLSSFGSLSHFKAENCPEGATERCADCPVECPFNANRYYLSRIPQWPTHILHPEPTAENITEILKTANYGRCVYKMDNDVVDHQIVNMLMEDDVTVSFQMVGFTNQNTRTIRIMGTEGEIWGDFKSNTLHWQRFGQQIHTVDLNALCSDFTGHGGGDEGLIADAISYFRGDDFDASSVTDLVSSVESHYMAFAAEESRTSGGQLIEMEDYIARLQS